jgi:maltose alpha-D-glucosyltransferase/alpha-amylase
MQSIFRLRKEAPEIGWGEISAVETGENAVLALRYDWRNNAVLCVHNLAARPIEVELRTGIAAPEGDLLIDLLTGSRSEAAADGRHTICLEGYGYHWYRVGGLDALLRRSPG